MEAFLEYGHALVAMALVSVILLLLSPLSALRKTSKGLAPGAEPPADYSDSCYRWHRAYVNLSEAIGPFIAVTITAILAGADASSVNMLASVFLLVRVLHLFVHILGLGKPDMSLRTFIYVAGWLCCLGLAFLAVKAVLGGG